MTITPANTQEPKQDAAIADEMQKHLDGITPALQCLNQLLQSGMVLWDPADKARTRATLQAAYAHALQLNLNIMQIIPAGSPPSAAAPAGLIEALGEVSTILGEIEELSAPPSMRWPLADELRGFALMLKAAARAPE